MATKKVTAVIKLQCPAGAATPAPPIGPALGPHGVSAPKFVQEFNDRTKSMERGLVIPVVITVYQDKSYTFILKTPPAAVQLLEAAKAKGGSPEPNRKKVASVTWEQVKAIAEDKMPDLNCFTVESAMRLVAGTARSMGITVTGEFPAND